MAKRKTQVLLLIGWDDEIDNHPSSWGIPSLVIKDAFASPGESCSILSVTEVDEQPEGDS